MPNSERIETLISPEALKQFETLKASTDANTASFEKLIAKAVELNKAVGNATTFKEINKATQEMTEHDKALAKQIEDLAKANAKLQALYEQQAQKIKALNEEKKKQRDDDKKGADAVAKAEEKLINSYSAEARKLAELREQQNLVNKANKQSAQETLGLSGAYKQLEAQYNKAAQEAKDLAVQFGAGSKQAKEASARALELDARLKAADANTGKFNRNVGNYSGALNTLQKALQDVTKKIEDNTRSGIQNEAVLEALQKEQGLLVSLVDAQSQGFKNATSEIRNNQQAILQLSQIYGEDSAVITELTKKTAELTDTVGDMKATIKAQASDTHVFDGLIGAAQGLVGVYSVAQGAAALFGDENEELQKTFVKLQAVMAVLQGLQAIQNALQKESAARQLINIGLQKAANLQTTLQTAAESKNVIVKYAAIVAQKALNLAMSAAGGPILAIIGLLSLLLISLSSFASATTKVKRNFEQLNEEFAGLEALLSEEVDFIKRAGDETVAELESQFASEAKIRKARSKALKEESAAIRRFLADNGSAYKEAFKDFEDFTSRQRAGEKLSEEEEKSLRQVETFVQKFQAARNRDFQLDSQLEIDRLNNKKAATEETIKVQQEEIEATKLQLQTRQQVQQSIAGDERKTQKERIEALKESARIQRQLINSDADSKRLTPGLTPSEIKVIEAGRTAALTQARRESNKAIEDLNRSYAERERKARFDITKTEIEDQIKAADLIAQNENKSFDQRTDALYAGYEKRRQIIIAQNEFDIQNDTLTAEERLAIERKYLSDINQLTIDYGLQQQVLYAQNQDKVNELIEKGAQARRDQITEDEALAVVELNKAKSDGLITIQEYENRRSDIEYQARVKTLNEDRKQIFARVILTKEGTAEREAAEKELAENTKAISDENLKHEEDNNAKRLANFQNTVQAIGDVYSNIYSSISEILSIHSDAESARIQEQLTQLDKQQERDKQVVEATITNAQEKAAALQEIDAKSQAKREALEKRQRQIDRQKAQFEKASNIANIITATALAVAKALPNIPLAATVGFLGAAQLARAIAAPLPAFEHGTDDAPGGPALVSEKRPELLITPDGKVMQTPARPTVMNVPKHSIVLPDARAALESGLAVNRHGRLVQSDNSNLKIEQKLDHIAKVIKNKPVLNMSADQAGLTAMWQYGANWVKYVEDQTMF
jgi:hypothetical protein